MNLLERSDELYRKMIDEVSDYAILLMDRDGNILNWNKGAENIKGYTAQEIVGKNFRTFYLDADRINKVPEQLIEQAVREGRAHAEGLRRRKDGSTFWGSIVITALHDSDNSVIGFTKVTRDLTERKAAEDKIRSYTTELEKQNKELAQYAYITSHDLQEPLRKIQTFIDLVLEEDDMGTIKGYLKKVAASAARMSALIKGVLNFIRVTETSTLRSKVDLNAIVQNVIQDCELTISQKKAKVEIAQLPNVLGIEIQLYQLFLNLIGNALKFNNNEPRITIFSHSLSAEESKNLALHPEYRYAKIIISDNGIGFDTKHSDLIFGLFQRLNSDIDKYPGTGLGLALCKKIVESHQGCIVVNSEIDKGSSFTIILPRE